MGIAWPRLLVLTNETASAPAPGMRQGYARLVASGELGSVRFLSWRDPSVLHEQVPDAVRDTAWDVLVVWSPRTFPTSVAEMADLDRSIAGRPVLMWEGDHWNSLRISRAALDYWLPRTSVVFNSAGGECLVRYIRAGASAAVTTVSGYDQVQFARAVESPPAPAEAKRVVMVASNPGRLVGKLLRQGAPQRYLLASRMRSAFGKRFELHGENWPARWFVEPVPFRAQIDVMRSAAFTATWDHYHRLPAAASNRMAISMLAGRPHIMSEHPDMEWMPGAEIGLFRAQSVGAALKMARWLDGLSISGLTQLGMEAYKFAKYRLSQDQLVRFMMSRVFESVAPPKAEPWISLARRGRVVR